MKRMPLNQIEQGQRLKRQMPIDKKLRLAQYIRAENMDNRMKIRQRERLLYGVDSAERNGFYSEEVPNEVTGTFRLRMAAAVILFIGFLMCDAGQYKIFGYSMNDVYGMISEDYFKLYDSENMDELPQLTELLDFNSKYH